jgi:hypothetical protein
MTKQGAKLSLLAVATTTVIVLCIYLSYKQRHSPSATVGSEAPSTNGPAVSTKPEPVADGWVRPRIGEFRKKVHGLTGDLADVQKRVMGEGEQVVARFKLGQAGRHLPGVGLTPETQEPTMQLPPQGRT